MHPLRNGSKRLQSEQIYVCFREDRCFRFVMLFDPAVSYSRYLVTYSFCLGADCTPRPVPVPIIALTVDTPALAADATMPIPISRYPLLELFSAGETPVPCICALVPRRAGFSLTSLLRAVTSFRYRWGPSG